MKLEFVFLFIAVVLLTVVNSSSQSNKQSSAEPMVALYGGNGSTLLRRCQAAMKEEHHTPTEAAEGAFCRGYVLGEVDGMVTLKSLEKTTLYCLPSNADPDQLVRVVMKYLNDNPADLHYPAGLLVGRAIMTAFPCKS